MLIDETPSVEGVKFDGCRVSFRVTGGHFPETFPSGGVTAAGWPRDDASNYLSSGPGRDVGTGRQSDRYKIDLSWIESGPVITGSAPRRAVAYLTLKADPGKDAIETKRKGKASFIPAMSFAVKTKSTGNVFGALRDMIAVCSAK